MKNYLERLIDVGLGGFHFENFSIDYINSIDHSEKIPLI